TLQRRRRHHQLDAVGPLNAVGLRVGDDLGPRLELRQGRLGYRLPERLRGRAGPQVGGGLPAAVDLAGRDRLALAGEVVVEGPWRDTGRRGDVLHQYVVE